MHKNENRVSIEETHNVYKFNILDNDENTKFINRRAW